MYTRLFEEFYPELQDRGWRGRIQASTFVILGIFIGIAFAMAVTTHLISPLIN